MQAQFSPQQQTVIDHIATTAGHTIVSARAGTGKTTTMINGVCRAIDPRCSIAFVAYGKAIATEAEIKVKNLGLNNVKVSTCHSAGFNAYRRIYKSKVENKKLLQLSRQEFNDQYESWRPFVIRAVEKAKDTGIGIVCPIDDTLQWEKIIDKFGLQDLLPEDVSIQQGIDAAIHLLRINNQTTNVIDFSDMIYMTLFHNIRIWQYDYVIVDEAQDLNATRRELVKRMLKPNGKLIAVGDPYQAIFGFTGADHDSMDIIKKEFNADVLPLSVTFRCPKAVVTIAKQWVPDIEAHETSPEGLYDSCELEYIHRLVTPQDVIICRNTKPLVELAYTLLRQSIACRVEGRSIGEGLIKLARRWKRVKNVEELDIKLEEWKKYEIQKAKEKDDNDRCQSIEDQVGTLRVFMEQCDGLDSISVLISKIEVLFTDTKSSDEQRVLTLSTIHKSKGREWNHVFVLGLDTYSPSKWAKSDWELEQEKNLCYVQVTRAKQHLTMVKVPPKQK
jgi:superfamily I DNA/RNA helicase